MDLITEFEFELPRGYLDENGELHKKGVMRMATAADEILPLRGSCISAEYVSDHQFHGRSDRDLRMPSLRRKI